MLAGGRGYYAQRGEGCQPRVFTAERGEYPRSLREAIVTGGNVGALGGGLHLTLQPTAEGIAGYVQVIARLQAGLEAAYQADVALLYERLFEISRARQQQRRSPSD